MKSLLSVRKHLNTKIKKKLNKVIPLELEKELWKLTSGYTVGPPPPNINHIDKCYEEEGKNFFLLCKKHTEVTHT